MQRITIGTKGYNFVTREDLGHGRLPEPPEYQQLFEWSNTNLGVQVEIDWDLTPVRVQGVNLWSATLLGATCYASPPWISI